MEGRYFHAKALQVGNDLIPFWNLAYETSETMGEMLVVDGTYESFSPSNLIDAVYDLKTGKFKSFLIKDIYEKPKFKKHEAVYRDVGSDTFADDVIMDIIYEDYDVRFEKAKKLKQYYKKDFITEELSNLKDAELVELRVWKPYYLMQSGLKVQYDFYLKHKG